MMLYTDIVHGMQISYVLVKFFRDKHVFLRGTCFYVNNVISVETANGP